MKGVVLEAEERPWLWNFFSDKGGTGQYHLP